MASSILLTGKVIDTSKKTLCVASVEIGREDIDKYGVEFATELVGMLQRAIQKNNL